jgi:erythromycin esterase-like protein
MAYLAANSLSMPKFIVTFIFFHFVLLACGQNQVKKFVKQTAVSISTLDPNSTDISDLQVIGNAIGDSRIVMLGEQDHGDAPTFLAKTRIIKYLHEKKGFNVIAFESDFFGLNYGWDNVKKEKGVLDSFLLKNIFPIWTYCNTCHHLFYEYVPETYTTDKPITITGFDNQMILEYSSKHLVSRLDSVLRSLDLAIAKDKDYVSKILPTIDSLKYFYSTAPKDSNFYSRCANYLKEIKRQAGEKLAKDNFWMITSENLILENLEFKTKDFTEKNNVRDSQMAQNLQWLVRFKFRAEKIIVWAASGHVAKYSEISKNYPYKKRITMGSYFTKDSSLFKQTYIIGFTSYDGVAGRIGWENYTIEKPNSDCFENWIDKSWQYAFVNLRTYKKKSELFYLKGLGHYSFLERDWANIFDAVFYVKKMYPCEKPKTGG